jgi:8-oxo-dGTP diphosphatase
VPEDPDLGKVPFLSPEDAADVAAGRFTALGALAIVVNDAGRVLMQLRDDRPDVIHPGVWSVLGGLREDGESLATTALREVEEETGLLGKSARPFRQLVDRDGRGHRLLAFIVPVCGDDSDVRLTEGQCVRFHDPASLDGYGLIPWARTLIMEFRCETSRADPRGRALAD